MRYLIVAKIGGLQSQGARGKAVVHLLQAPNNAGSGALRLSGRVNNMATIDPILQIHPWLNPHMEII